MEKNLKEPYPGVPEKVFPMKPISTYWMLDPAEHIEICRRGFPLVPHFSSTIDGITGATLDRSIADVGDFGRAPSYKGAMQAYIAFSRVEAADHMLIAQPFNPLLFRMGPQPWPTLLFRLLAGEMCDKAEHEIIDVCRQTEEACKTQPLLRDLDWKCGGCARKVPWFFYFLTEESQNSE